MLQKKNVPRPPRAAPDRSATAAPAAPSWEQVLPDAAAYDATGVLRGVDPCEPGYWLVTEFLEPPAQAACRLPPTAAA